VYKLIWCKGVRVVCLLCATTAIAQTFTTLASFNISNGAFPQYVSLAQGLDGNFYGTTEGGGVNNNCTFGTCGTAFKVTPGGALTTLYNFCAQVQCTDGFEPVAGLLLASDGNFYGTTFYGGAGNPPPGYGTVFEITPSGTLKTLHSFCAQPNCPDGYGPQSTLVRGTDGILYGTTTYGGAGGNGTIFKITPKGILTTLHSFNFYDGSLPIGGLVQTADGDFYGTTQYGGLYNYGTVFRLTRSNAFTTLHSFSYTDGANPVAGLVQANDGNFYGTAESGGINGWGTVFKSTPSGTLRTLYSFCAHPNCTDGQYPTAGLVQATDGNFYGTTYVGGDNDAGTVFQITPGGILTTLHSFDGTDGDVASAALVQATDGNFYGTTMDGGTGPCASGCGTVFSQSVGLGPFVKTLPTSGKLGAAVKILGTNLTGTTSVSFHGRAAAFSVISASEISTTVPAGATTGKVQVTTPGATLSSNVVFRVMPMISSFSPTSGPAGTAVVITGESLTGATSVTFGGVKATSFTVNSYTQITATVPSGAKTGRISVTTPGGTAVSAGIFTVT
jgi:uncharacterized repeat protein (TIGR03803 family)